MYTAIGVKNIDKILPPPQQPQPMDPAAENIMSMSGKPFQAFKGQDHQAHITTHLNFMATNIARNNPVVLAALEKNIFEHISLMAQEQLEVEFREELAKLMQLQQAMAQNPMLQQDPNVQQQIMSLSMSLESRKAKLIAEMTEDFTKHYPDFCVYIFFDVLDEDDRLITEGYKIHNRINIVPLTQMDKDTNNVIVGEE